MTCTSSKTLRRRRLAAAVLALPLALAMTGTAIAAGPSTAELRTASAGSSNQAADTPADKSPDKAAKAEPAVKAEKAEPAAKTDKREAASTGSAAGAAAGQSAASSTRDSSSNPDKHGAATSGPLTAPQPLSNADKNGTGANPGPTCSHSYCSTRDGSASQNGNGGGTAGGKPCAGCVGKADNKNPKGQAPDGSDHNNGYECDGNNGVGKTNPAHTGCRSATTSPTPKPTVTKSPTPKPTTTKSPKPTPTGTKSPTPKPTATKSPKPTPTGTKSPKPTSTATPGSCPDGSKMPKSGNVADCKPSEGKITICHATGSATNPYVVITISTNGLNGHGKHEGDIIPMPAGGCPKAPTTVTDACPNLAGIQMPGTSCTPPPGGGGGGPLVDVCPDVAGMQTMAPCVLSGGGGGPAQNPPAGTPIVGTPVNQPATGPATTVGPPTSVPPVIVPNGTVAPLAGTITSPAVLPAVARPAATGPRTLPFTGTDTALLIQLGLLLFLAGGGVLVAARRERTARAG